MILLNLLLLPGLLIRTAQCSFEFFAHNFVNYKVRGADYGLPYIAVHGKLRQFVPERLGLASQGSKRKNEGVKSLTKDETKKVTQLLADLLKKGRNVYLLRVEDLLTDKYYWLFFSSVLKTQNNSLVLILPKKQNVLPGANVVCDEAHATDFANAKLPACPSSPKVTKDLLNSKLNQDTLFQLEKFLYKSKPKCSISVTEMDENVLEILKHTKSSGGLLSDDVRVSAREFQANPVNTFLTINLYGELNTTPLTSGTNFDDSSEWKQGSGESEDAGASNRNENATNEGTDDGKDSRDKGKLDKKRILLTTSLDTFGVLQTYSSNAQFNSSLIFMLELIRLLRNVKSDNYDLVFLLHSGSVVDYAGLKYFLKTNKKDLEFVVNFTDLSGDSLYLHLVKSNESSLEQLTRVFSTKMNVATIVKQVNQSGEPAKEDLKARPEEDNFELSFPNEVDFKTNHNSFTVTSNLQQMPLYKTSYSLNYKVDVDLLAQRIVDATKAFVQLLKSTPLDLNVEEIKKNVVRWENALGEPRNCLNTNLLVLNSVKDVIAHMESNLGKANVQNFRVNVTNHKFLTSAPNKCTVYTTKHPAFDILVFALVTAYILLAWSVARGSFKAAVEDIMDIFEKALNEKNFRRKLANYEKKGS